jgi:hypothetical protein
LSNVLIYLKADAASVRLYGLSECSYVNNVYITILMATGLANAVARGVVNCTDVTAVDVIFSRMQATGQVYAFTGSRRLLMCSARSLSGSNEIRGGFQNCLEVHNCRATNGLMPGFDTSYSSISANATYICAPTLNGGWNQSI